MSFRENLIKLRKAKNLSQDDLAEELGLSRQAVSKWENENSKPDVENLIKLSKIVKVSVDDLIGNQIVETEAAAINLNYNEEKKTKKVLVWLKRLIIVALVLYFVNTIYRFILLFRVTSIDKQYKELNNYHYVITSYDEEDIISKEECWFKDGVSKTINTIYNESEENNKKKEKIICIDYNKNQGYSIENESKRKLEQSEIEIYKSIHGESSQLYLNFPSILQYNGIIEITKTSLDSLNAIINISEDDIIMNVNNYYLCMDKETLCPKIFYESNNKSGNEELKRYDIEINSVKDLKI